MRRRIGLGLIGLVLIPLPVLPAGAHGPAEYVGTYVWRSDDPLMGGLSAIELGPDGTGFTVVSDRGAFTRGQFDRDAECAVSGLAAEPFRKLKGKAEALLPKARADSEGLAIAADGTAFVSLEGVTRVLRYKNGLDGPATNLPRPDAFKKMGRNSSLEALAITESGTLFTVPEQAGRGKGPFPVWRFRDGVWDQPYVIEREGSFLPVSADIGPDGLLYLLERDFQGIGGFASRVRRFQPDSFGAGDLVLQSDLGRHDNLEGLAVWQDAAGDIRLTMVSDDNFRFFQRTEFVDYRLPD